VILIAFAANPVAIMLLSHQAQLGQRYDLYYFVLALLLVHNWGFTEHLAWNIPSWSISTEWFAYLAFPPLAHVMVAWGRKISVTLLTLGTTLCFLGGIFWLSGAQSIGNNIVSLGLPRCLFEFVAGTCICSLYRSEFLTSPVASYCSMAVALGLTMLSVAVHIPNYFTVPIVSCLLVSALTVRETILGRLLSAPVLQFLGEISYSTYMVHYLIKDWVKFLLVRSNQPELLPSIVYIVLVFLASVLLYRIVEVPGKRLILSHLEFRSNAAK
jgi:peptidoglycan/LPS O-acetylase OafA/YrhL